jgi:hypothetical protein
MSYSCQICNTTFGTKNALTVHNTRRTKACLVAEALVAKLPDPELASLRATVTAQAISIASLTDTITALRLELADARARVSVTEEHYGHALETISGACKASASANTFGIFPLPDDFYDHVATTLTTDDVLTRDGVRNHFTRVFRPHLLCRDASRGTYVVATYGGEVVAIQQATVGQLYCTAIESRVQDLHNAYVKSIDDKIYRGKMMGDCMKVQIDVTYGRDGNPHILFPAVNKGLIYIE